MSWRDGHVARREIRCRRGNLAASLSLSQPRVFSYRGSTEQPKNNGGRYSRYDVLQVANVEQQLRPRNIDGDQKVLTIRQRAFAEMR